MSETYDANAPGGVPGRHAAAPWPDVSARSTHAGLAVRPQPTGQRDPRADDQAVVPGADGAGGDQGRVPQPVHGATGGVPAADDGEARPHAAEPTPPPWPPGDPQPAEPAADSADVQDVGEADAEAEVGDVGDAKVGAVDVGDVDVAVVTADAGAPDPPGDDGRVPPLTSDSGGSGSGGPSAPSAGQGGDESVPDDPQGASLDDPAHLRSALEAVLLVVDTPVAAPDLAQVLEQPPAAVEAALAALRDEYDEQRRGFCLREVAGGWRLYTRDEYAHHVERYVLDGQQTRLTQAALETLAVVAYRQPVTRSRIAAIRGVGVDGVMRTLLTRNLVEECGTDPETGGNLYRTTTLFLEKLGLRSLEELPSLAPLLPEIDTVDDVASSA